MAEVITRKKKENNKPPVLLLANIYFLNRSHTKFILIGYNASIDFKPVIVFQQDGSFVEFTLSDWQILTSNKILIENWFTHLDINETTSIVSKNVGIKKAIKLNTMYVQIQNSQRKKPINTILLNTDEYNKCTEIDLFVQNVIKTFQFNWFDIQDYYNTYVLKCNTKKSVILNEEDYFPSENCNFDTYRLFKEISYFCNVNLYSDVTFYTA